MNDLSDHPTWVRRLAKILSVPICWVVDLLLFVRVLPIRLQLIWKRWRIRRQEREIERLAGELGRREYASRIENDP